jgi:basic amino acid/polyamine antiporter, APA family
MVVGTIIGASIFVQPSEMSGALPSIPALLLAWVAAGLLTVVGSLICAELSSAYPRTGGIYVFLSETLSPAAGFLWAWAMFWSMHSGIIAALAVICARYAAYLVPLSAAGQRATAIAVILVLSAVNYIGVREGAWVQRIFTMLKIAGILLLVGSAFWGAHPLPGTLALPEVPFSLGAFGVAMTACLMAYNGWSYVNYVAGEVRDPQRNLPRSLTLGMLISGALYLLANVAYLKVLTISEIRLTDRVGAVLAERTMGAAGATVLAVTVMLSVIGAINGNILTAARIPFAAAHDQLFFPRFGRIHPRFETPSFAIVMQAVWASVLVVSGTYESLASYTIVAGWIFFVLTVAAVPILRRKLPHLDRPYRMWGYPYTLVLFLIVGTWFVGNAFVTQPGPSLAALAIVATGVPAYLFWRKPG